MSAQERQKLLDGRSTPKYERQPRPQRRQNRSLHLSITFLILGFVVLYSQRKSKSKADNAYSVGGTLPERYAICSKAKKIYTVPEDSGIGAVECVVVLGKEVFDTGSRGVGLFAKLI
jgi:hypothetical protein